MKLSELKIGDRVKSVSLVEKVTGTVIYVVPDSTLNLYIYAQKPQITGIMIEYEDTDYQKYHLPNDTEIVSVDGKEIKIISSEDYNDEEDLPEDNGFGPKHL